MSTSGLRWTTGPATVFGLVDGLTVVMSLVAGLVIARASPYAIWHAALAGGLAELFGMSAGQYRSAPEDGKLTALACGMAGAIAAVAPAIPYLVTRGAAATASAVIIALCIGAVIVWLRPERGWRAFATTYGIIAVASLASAVSGLA